MSSGPKTPTKNIGKKNDRHTKKEVFSCPDILMFFMSVCIIVDVPGGEPSNNSRYAFRKTKRCIATKSLDGLTCGDACVTLTT